MSVEAKYKTTSTAMGGRDGRTRTEDGKIDLQVAVPKELGGPRGEDTTRGSCLPLVTSQLPGRR